MGPTISAPGASPANAPQPADNGRSNAGRNQQIHTVESGESFWTISSDTLEAAWGREPTDAEIDAYSQQVQQANADRLEYPGNFDLIYPGQEFVLPPPGADPQQPQGAQPEGPQKEGPQKEGPQKEGPQKEGPQKEGPQKEGPQKEGPQKEGPQKEGPQKEGPQKEGPGDRKTAEKTAHEATDRAAKDVKDAQHERDIALSPAAREAAQAKLDVAEQKFEDAVKAEIDAKMHYQGASREDYGREAEMIANSISQRYGSSDLRDRVLAAGEERATEINNEDGVGGVDPNRPAPLKYGTRQDTDAAAKKVIDAQDRLNKAHPDSAEAEAAREALATARQDFGNAVKAEVNSGMKFQGSSREDLGTEAQLIANSIALRYSDPALKDVVTAAGEQRATEISNEQ